MTFLKCKIGFIYVGNHLKFPFWLFETLPNLTSIFVPNFISKNCQISSKHQPQDIGQISISKSWPNPVLHVWTKLQLKKSDKKFSLDILTKLQLLYQSVVNTFLIHIDTFSTGIFAYQSHISQVWNWETDKAM